MTYQPPVPVAGKPSPSPSSHPHQTGWNNPGQPNQGDGMKHNIFGQSQWNNSHLSQPSSSPNNFTQPSPSSHINNFNQHPPPHHSNFPQQPPPHQNSFSQPPPTNHTSFLQPPPTHHNNLSQPPPTHHNNLSQPPPTHHNNLSQNLPPHQNSFSQHPPPHHNNFSQQPPHNNFSQQPPPHHNNNFSQQPPPHHNNFSQPPPPHHNNFSQPPPTAFRSNRPPPAPAVTNNRLPTNVYPPSPHINRPPPSVPPQGFPPIANLLQPPYPPSLPPGTVHGQNNHPQQTTDGHSAVPDNFKINTSNLSTDREVCQSEIEKKRKIGQQCLASWLHKNGKVKKKIHDEKISGKLPSIKLNEYLCQLKGCMTLVSEMSGQIERLESVLSDADKPMWQQECSVMDTLKVKHNNLKSVLEKSMVQQVEMKMNRTRHRKIRRKSSRHQQFLQMQELEEARQAKEKEINDWQQRILSEMKEDLMKKKRKQQMDQTLSEVTKKINDANRLVDTMTALEKLRLIRQDTAMKRGDSDLGESRESFEQKICDMTRLVRSQLEVYREEEDKLRNVIKSEQEETSKKERQLQANKDLEEQRQKDEDLSKMLFGFTGDADLSDPLFPYQQYYNQAQTNLPALVHIRQEWDQHVVPSHDPNGGCIPSGWVLPSDPSSTVWASALV